MKTKILDLTYSVAAAVVIFGAYCKLMHFSFADIALTAGLLTEVVIFLIYGLEAFLSKPEPTARPHSGEYPNQDRLEAAVRETNAILRDVYKTRK
jgi:hypothetical protein